MRARLDGRLDDAAWNGAATLTLDRTHDPLRVPAAVDWARRTGFDDISLDLIYGTPGESDDDWRASLDRALSAAPTHVSAYALIVEDGTRLEGGGICHVTEHRTAYTPSEAAAETIGVVLMVLAVLGFLGKARLELAEHPARHIACGGGCDALIPSRPPKEAIERRRKDANKLLKTVKRKVILSGLSITRAMFSNT